MVNWLLGTIRAMVMVFGKVNRRLVIEAVFAFGRPALLDVRGRKINALAASIAVERLRALEDKLLQDEYGHTRLYEGRQVVSCLYNPAKGGAKTPYVLTCVNDVYALDSKAAERLKFITRTHVEGVGTCFVSAPQMISDEELVELRILQTAHRYAEKAGLIKGSVSYKEDGTQLVTRKSKAHSKGEATDRELFQDRHSKEEDETRERQHFLVAEARSKKMVPTTQRNLVYTEGPNGRLRESEENYGEILRESGRDPNDVERETEALSFFDHEGYDGVLPLRAPTKKENGMGSRPRYRLGWEMLSANLAPNGSYKECVVVTDGWKRQQLGLKLQFYAYTCRMCGKVKEREVTVDGKCPCGEKVNAKLVRFWNKAMIPFEFLTLHNLVKRTTEAGETYMAAGPLLLADGSTEPEVIKEALKTSDGRKALKIKGSFRAELEAMLRGIVESNAMETIEIVRKDMGRWTRGSKGRPFAKGTLKMRCNTCTKMARKAKFVTVDDSGTKRPITEEERKLWLAGAEDRVWTSDVHCDYCPICNQQMWQLKIKVVASTKLLPFVNWTQLKVVPEFFTFEIFGDLVKELYMKHWKPRVTPEVRTRLHYNKETNTFVSCKVGKKKAKAKSKLDPHAKALHELRRDIIRRNKARLAADACIQQKIAAEKVRYVLAHPEPEAK